MMTLDDRGERRGVRVRCHPVYRRARGKSGELRRHEPRRVVEVTPNPVIVLDRHYADWAAAFSGFFEVTVSGLDGVLDLDPRNPVRAIITAGVRPLPPEVLQLPYLG